MDKNNCAAENDLREIKSGLAEIKAALLGSEYHPSGIIHKVRELEIKIEEQGKLHDKRTLALENAQNRIKWVAVGFFMAGGGSGALVFKIFGG